MNCFFFHFSDLKLPTIILDRLDVKVSHRVVHQLVSRIFAIFLKEIYRFDKVYIDSGMDYSFMDGLNENSLAYAPVMEVVNDHNMNPAVNLVAPIPPNFHVAYSPRVFQGGSLTHDLFRYGLFVLNTTSPKKYTYEDFMKNNSRYYNIIKDFKFSQNEIERNVEPFLDTSNGNKGFFIPQQCNSDSEPCVIVLTSFYNDTKFFIDHIDEFKFKLKVYFLGDRLIKVINDINDRNFKMMKTGLKQPLNQHLVLHWTPSEIIDNPTLHFESVEMPKCELYLNENRTCRYEIVPVKTVINDLAKKSSVFYELMNNVHFPSVKPLLNIYHKFLPEIETLRLNRKIEMFDGPQSKNESIENIYNKIACLWLQENPEVYSTHEIERWINVLESEIEISIGGL